MCWKEEKKLVQEILDEKKDLLDLVLILKNKNPEDLSITQKKLLERYSELESLIQCCFEILSDTEQLIIICSYIKKITDFELAIEIGVSERTACTYKKKVTIKLANLIRFYLS